MTDRRVELEECPLNGCDAPVDFAIKTTRGTKLTTQNLTQDRTCLIPTTMEVVEEPVPAAFIVYHKDIDGKAEDADDPDADAEDDQDDDDEEEDPVDLSDLDEFETRLYHFISNDLFADLATIQGKFTASGRDLDEIEGAVGDLVRRGYLEEPEEDTYRVVS